LKAVELVIPGGSKDDGTLANESVLLASWFAFACMSANPIVRNAVETIGDEYDKGIAEFIQGLEKK
jgi:hypothetical protein